MADEALGDLTKNVFEATGLKQPQTPSTEELQQQASAVQWPRKVPMTLLASPQLNHDAQKRPLSLVVRLYKLKGSSAFQKAPYEAFSTPGKDKEFLGDDIVEVRELLLTPGQRLVVDEKVPRDATALGIVALFHAPATQRWKFAFDAATAEKSGLVVAAHACALTVSQGQPLEPPVDALMLGGAPCGR